MSCPHSWCKIHFDYNCTLSIDTISLQQQDHEVGEDVTKHEHKQDGKELVHDHSKVVGRGTFFTEHLLATIVEKPIISKINQLDVSPPDKD